jgi:hypothetical protein
MVLSWKTMLDAPLTIFALAICPIVALIFVLLHWFRRDPASRPSVAAAVPIGLSSIAILLGQSAVVLLAAFNRIATHQTAGIGAVISGLLQAQQPLAWGFLDFVACLIVVLLFAVYLGYSRDEETPLIHAYVALPALIATAVMAVFLFLIIYLQYGTVDLVMMIVDTHRNHELVSQFGMVSPAYFAARISFRLVAITFLSFSEFAVLIAVGFLSLFWKQKQSSRQSFALAFTLGALIACGVSALSEFTFIDYLRHVR